MLYEFTICIHHCVSCVLLNICTVHGMCFKTTCSSLVMLNYCTVCWRYKYGVGLAMLMIMPIQEPESEKPQKMSIWKKPKILSYWSSNHKTFAMDGKVLGSTTTNKSKSNLISNHLLFIWTYNKGKERKKREGEWREYNYICGKFPFMSTHSNSAIHIFCLSLIQHFYRQSIFGAQFYFSRSE